MIGRQAAALVVLCALCGGARAGARRPADGFDHRGHARELERAGVEAPPCAGCHPGDASRPPARPDHSACFGACHGPPPPARPRRARRRARPYPIEKDRIAICRACHRPAALARLAAGTREPLRASYPPYDHLPDFGVRAAHTAHKSVAAGCRGCHQVPPDPGGAAGRAPPDHGRCAGCHAGAGGAGPKMEACEGCHLPRSEAANDAPRFPVARFTHRAHLGRLTEGQSCTSCHLWDALTPKKATCRRCHDGQSAFSMVEPACRRCHTPPAPRRRDPRPARRFSHSRHRDRGLDLTCGTCHRLGEGGAPEPAAADHAPCSEAGCHAADFAARKPTTCGACHVGFEPWLDLDADRPPPRATEFGSRFSHRAHLGGASPRLKAACESCHQRAPGSRAMRPPRGHRACSGASCHASAAGARPHLSSCRGCHVPGLLAGHLLSRTKERWSVRERFDHAPHRFEPGSDKKKVPCTSCHRRVLASDRLEDVPVPAKASCARCHDGEAAFKLTGHHCARCHGGS